MDIKIVDIKEYKNGTADMIVHYDEEAKNLLIEAGIMSILEGYVEKKMNRIKSRRLNEEWTSSVDGLQRLLVR